jgi:hypothetical protein
MKFLCCHPESDSFWIEEAQDEDDCYKKIDNPEVDFELISPGNLIFKHYATDELKQVKTVVQTENELVVEEVRSRKLLVVINDPINSRIVIKGTSFIKIVW